MTWREKLGAASTTTDDKSDRKNILSLVSSHAIAAQFAKSTELTDNGDTGEKSIEAGSRVGLEKEAAEPLIVRTLCRCVRNSQEWRERMSISMARVSSSLR